MKSLSTPWKRDPEPVWLEDPKFHPNGAQRHIVIRDSFNYPVAPVPEDEGYEDNTVNVVEAAADMLAALEAIRSRAAETGQTNATREIIRWCDAAIAKAKAP